MLFGPLLGVCVAFVSVVAGARNCGLPSHLWCSSRQTARDCQVTRQCEASDWRHREAAPPVNLTLYYEALCPFCKMFITQQLYPTFQKVQGDVLNITILPFGNAEMIKKGDKWEFQCQHGENECAGNLMATCVINSKNYSVSGYLPFLNCMENSASERVKWDDVLEQCGPKFNISQSAVKSCTAGALGNTLEHQMGEATKKERVEYVPWIVINGHHSKLVNEEAQKDLLKLVCKTYTGPKPQACTQVLDHWMKNVSFRKPQKAKFARKY